MRLPAFILFHRLTNAGGAFFWLLTFTGCASGTRPTAARAESTKPVVIGEVALVDEEEKFVLIDLDSNLYVPQPGVTLRTTNATGQTGRLKVSPEQKRPFVAADIIAGNPAVGDQVVR